MKKYVLCAAVVFLAGCEKGPEIEGSGKVQCNSPLFTKTVVFDIEKARPHISIDIQTLLGWRLYFEDSTTGRRISITSTDGWECKKQ